MSTNGDETTKAWTEAELVYRELEEQRVEIERLCREVRYLNRAVALVTVLLLLVATKAIP